ncbi:MAG: inosine/xanthosine triphosphatase [Candidatus Acidiferrales bacterium]|jgi:non-canonical (house-cleaning) NTP pyrophosphatase
MKKIIVAVGSTRRPKLNAVTDALAAFGMLLDSEATFEVTGLEVPSGVGHTPLSRADLMAGARNRAEALRAIALETKSSWEFFVGLEGGFDIVRDDEQRLVFLESWAYVLDRAGHGYFGRSGAVLVPEPLAAAVVDSGIELGVAVDQFAGGRGIRDAQGAWGVLTRDIVTRQEAFRVALIGAFAPFYNSAAYRANEATASG